MAQSPYYFGAKTPWSGRYGGWNLGGIQDDQQPQNSVTQTTNLPSAGVANSVPGRPATGGMHALSPTPLEGWADQPADQTGGAPDSAGSSPAASGPGFSVGEAASTAGRGGSLSIGTPFGSVGPGTPGTISSLSGLVGGPTLGSLGLGAFGPAGSVLGAANALSSLAANSMVDPATGLPVSQLANNPAIVAASPTFSAEAPAVGNPNMNIGKIIAAIQDSNPPTGSTGGFAFGSNGSTIDANGMISNSLGARTGESLSNTIPDANTTQVPDAPPAAPIGEPTGEPTGDPTGDAAAAAAAAGSTAAGIAGDAAGAAAAGDAGGTSGGAGVMKRGGRVGRPDPRMLAAKLRAGARVDQGSRKPGQDDVPVRLSRGEIVENLDAAKAHGAQLTKWNEEGRKKMDQRGRGSMAVGYRSGGTIAETDARDVHGRPDHRAARAGGFAIRSRS